MVGRLTAQTGVTALKPPCRNHDNAVFDSGRTSSYETRRVIIEVFRSDSEVQLWLMIEVSITNHHLPFAVCFLRLAQHCC